MATIYLLFKEKTFKELTFREPEQNDVVLEINTELKEAILSIPSKTSLIERRIAQRHAESICKSGFLMKTGARIGQRCILTIKSTKDINENLLRPANIFGTRV